MTARIPEGHRSLTPAITCTPCSEAIDFYVRAFSAEEVFPRMAGPDGTVAHAELRISDSVLRLGDEWPEGATRSPTALVGGRPPCSSTRTDVDALWQRMLDAGAEVVFLLELQFYGDKAGRVRGPFGHTWGPAQRVEDVSDEEMERRMAAFHEGGDENVDRPAPWPRRTPPVHWCRRPDRGRRRAHELARHRGRSTGLHGSATLRSIPT